MKIFLTSAGFENKKIGEKFLDCIAKEPSLIKVLFIPTAAINAESIAVLPKCMNDLLNCGIPKENIAVYDLHKEMTLDELNEFDAVYICGGDTQYLLNRINEQKFNLVLNKFAYQEGVIVGVSAGSIIAVRNLSDNLGYANCFLSVHCENGNGEGKLDFSTCPEIRLTNNQAIFLTEIDEGYIIG